MNTVLLLRKQRAKDDKFVSVFHPRQSPMLPMDDIKCFGKTFDTQRETS